MLRSPAGITFLTSFSKEQGCVLISAVSLKGEDEERKVLEHLAVSSRALSDYNGHDFFCC